MLDGVRNHVAPSNSSAVARSGPRVSAPQIGCPPTKRASPATASQTGTFVEPTSVTVLVSGATESVSRTWEGSDETGAATRTSSAAPDGVRQARRRLDRAAAGGDAESVRVGIPAGDLRDTRAPCSERGGRADQTRPDDGERTERRSHQPRISSATRKARSSDCLAFSRGSQSVS